MPIPLSKEPSKIISFLHRENKKRPKGKKWTRKQIIAIAMERARKAGAKIPKK